MSRARLRDAKPDYVRVFSGISTRCARPASNSRALPVMVRENVMLLVTLNNFNSLPRRSELIAAVVVVVATAPAGAAVERMACYGAHATRVPSRGLHETLQPVAVYRLQVEILCRETSSRAIRAGDFRNFFALFTFGYCRQTRSQFQSFHSTPTETRLHEVSSNYIRRVDQFGCWLVWLADNFQSQILDLR